MYQLFVKLDLDKNLFWSRTIDDWNIL